VYISGLLLLLSGGLCQTVSIPAAYVRHLIGHRGLGCVSACMHVVYVMFVSTTIIMKTSHGVDFSRSTEQ